uniref:Uncharacterized protein n=1 Tax=Arundo donax TaxID=35708 RepID=A0A0A8ZS57_ARUDO
MADKYRGRRSFDPLSVAFCLYPCPPLTRTSL